MLVSLHVTGMTQWRETADMVEGGHDTKAEKFCEGNR